MQIALIGAGGKMGLRLTDNLLKTTYDVRYVETGERGRAALAIRGISPVPITEAARDSDIVVLALPDNCIGGVTAEIASQFRSGAMLMTLDIAAPLAGVLPKREDLAFFITHPCHPSIFSEEDDPEARRDFFGFRAQQNIVCSLMQGPEEAYSLGEQVARALYAPVLRSHRCTPLQMAILEPVLSETVLGTCLTVVREAMDEAIRRGVPAEAARDFLLGHIKVELGIVFQEFEGATFSDGALQAIGAAKSRLFRPDWKRVFDSESMMESTRQIAGIASPR
jgi:D-apionate oxidoisomerase